MFECSLKFVLIRRPLCPCCLEELNDALFVFSDNLAFCPLCTLAHMDGARNECMRVFFELLDSRHTASFRRLWFFTPSDRPHRPVQLLPATDLDRRFIRSDVPLETAPVVDDNPVAGGLAR